MCALLMDEDEGRTARAINRRDDRARLAQHIAAEWDLTIRSAPPQAGCIGYESEVTLPRVDWQAVAIAVVAVALMAGLWGFIIYRAWREVTHA